MSAASLSALTLGSFMCTLIVVCRRYDVNPDNVAPPIASALGDLITLFLLSTLSTLLLPTLPTLLPLFLTLFLLLLATWTGYRTFLNTHVKPLLKQGWSPLVGAMLITSFSGLVLDRFVDRYEGYGLIAIVITGLPGGVGSIFVSRISTLLHASSPQSLPGLQANGHVHGKQLALPTPTSANELEERAPLRPSEEADESEELNGHSSSTSPNRTNLSLSTPEDAQTPTEDPDARLFLFAGTLFTITFPVQILFLLFLHISGWVELKWTFVFVFMVMFSGAVLGSLSLANWLTHFLWSKGLDPDMYAMPIQSSLVDLLGQCLLVLSYELTTLLGSDMIARDPR